MDRKLCSNIALSWLSWTTISTVGCEEGMVNIYDSLFIDVDDETQKAIRKVFNESNISFSLPKVQRQKGTNDCGVFAVAFATKLSEPCFSISDGVYSVCLAWTSDYLIRKYILD